jgi:UDP-N-acetylglucosamine/UDP-N-acetylgalactosamine diphosphorylase
MVAAVAQSGSVEILRSGSSQVSGRVDFGEIVYLHLRDQLSQHGQEHLLNHWHELDTNQQEELASEIMGVDCGLINRLHREYSEPQEADAIDPASIGEPRSVSLIEQNGRISGEAARTVGEAALGNGLVGVVIVAGGQGSRLGFEHPKGMFPIGAVSNATLFQILIEKIRATADRYGVSIPLYLMSSPATHSETVEFLDQNERFGLAEQDLQVFCQGKMPAVDQKSGRMLLKSKNELFFSPNGHGGMLEALDDSGCLADMSERGIEHLFYCQVDNSLVEMIRPEFIGHHILANSELTTQVIRKGRPDEKVGNVVAVDGKVQIIEYSDLSSEIANQRKANGSLSVWAGNTAVHVFSVSFLERVVSDANGLPFHFASKKIAHIDSDGGVVQPEETNGVKFERFIFDLMPLAQRALVFEVDRDLIYAPLKNAEGTESADWVRERVSNLHAEWLAAAGAQVADGVRVEISPLFANSAEEVKEKIEPGQSFDRDIYLA